MVKFCSQHVEICGDENLLQWSQLEIGLTPFVIKSFCKNYSSSSSSSSSSPSLKASIILRKQFIITIIIIIIIIIIIKNFIFNEIYYFQRTGCAMGTLCIPSHGSILMGRFKNKVIYPCVKVFFKLPPSILLRSFLPLERNRKATFRFSQKIERL